MIFEKHSEMQFIMITFDINVFLYQWKSIVPIQDLLRLEFVLSTILADGICINSVHHICKYSDLY